MTFCRLALGLLGGAAVSAVAAEPNVAIVLNADARMAAQPLRHYWSAAEDGGSVSRALRATWQDHWHMAVAECGFRAVRLDGVFDPALGVYHYEAGHDRLDFSALDDLFDRLIANNTHPFLRLNLPAVMVTAGRVGPALTRLAQHYYDRYGSPELRQWAFELGPRPAGDFAASYRSAAEAIRSVDSQLRVGGPLDQLAGLSGVPVDFVSARYVPPAGAGPEAMSAEIRRLRAAIAARGFPKAELQLTEGEGDAPVRNYIHDSLPAAAWMLRTILEQGAGLDMLAAGTFSDQAEPASGEGLFHGGAGLISAQGVVKPAFHAYRYLNALGDELLTAAPGGIVSRRKNSGRVVVLAYNVPPEAGAAWPTAPTLAAADRLASAGSARTVSLSLSSLRPGGQILIEMLDLTHGNAVEAWERMGSPPEPTRPALAALQSGAREMRLEYHQADELGRFSFSTELKPWSVLFLREL